MWDCLLEAEEFIAVPEQCYNNQNVEITGNDIGAHGPSSDANACRAYCASVSGATHFTKDNHQCMCKTSDSGNTQNFNGYWSGNVLCGGELLTIEYYNNIFWRIS